MIFTVLWVPNANRNLARLCVDYFDHGLAAITASADRIDELLRDDPESKGQPSFDTVRTLEVHPLAVDFEIDEGDRKVHVLDVWLTGQP